MYFWSHEGRLMQHTILEIFKTHFSKRFDLYKQRILTDIQQTRLEHEHQVQKNNCIEMVQKHGVEHIDEKFLGLPIGEFSKKAYVRNKKKAEQLLEKIELLEKQTPQKLWLEELRELKNELGVKKSCRN